MRLSKKMTMVTVLAVAVFALTQQATAQLTILRYSQNGPWEDVSDGVTNGWRLNPSFPGGNVPDGTGPMGDEARINWGDATVTLNYAAPAFENLKIGVDEGAILEVENGGVLTATDINVGHNSSSGNSNIIDGVMDIFTGGTVNVTNNFFMSRVDNEVQGFMTIQSGAVVSQRFHVDLL